MHKFSFKFTEKGIQNIGLSLPWGDYLISMFKASGKELLNASSLGK